MKKTEMYKGLFLTLLFNLIPAGIWLIYMACARGFVKDSRQVDMISAGILSGICGIVLIMIFRFVVAQFVLKGEMKKHNPEIFIPYNMPVMRLDFITSGEYGNKYGKLMMEIYKACLAVITLLTSVVGVALLSTKFQ